MLKVNDDPQSIHDSLWEDIFTIVIHYNTVSGASLQLICTKIKVDSEYYWHTKNFSIDSLYLI